MSTFKELCASARDCRICEKHLPLGPNPVFQINRNARILLIGQAPGKLVHESGVPWKDKSGDRLREWLGIDEETFYKSGKIAIMPMGFCYPGTGKTGDLPPRPECAPEWHEKFLKVMPSVKLTLLLGQYAQSHYLGDRRKENLTETVRAWREYLPEYIPLPHPSPLNNRWMAKNRWFENEVIPYIKHQISTGLN